MLQSFSGASIRRVIDRSHARIPEHAHDWPLLSIFVIGGYSNQTERGETFIAAPSAILYRAGAWHRNIIGPAGFEQIEVEFDPAWLGRTSMPDAPVSQWLGGRAGAEARALAHLCAVETNEGRLRAALLRFIEWANGRAERDPPDWVGALTRRVCEDAATSVSELAEQVRRHPSWIGTAYRRATGERLQEAAARFRVERAARMLRETDRACVDIAAEAGFCDQSHMNRTFRRVLRRSPSEVRQDRWHFRQARA